ncbi:MAG: lysophospholipid acyltransferase family protein [Parachlamydiaceae bacterium]|nr:lysophospholipid acyltransferase family protein [Parachlamydiaceae bacterium]
MLKSLYDTVKNKWLPPLFAYSAKIVIRLLLRTCRCEVQGLDHFVETAANSSCILMLWHDRLILVGEILNQFAPQFIYTAFISNSRDGKPLSLMALSYKAGRVLHVPHNARRKALKEMINHLKRKQEVIIITPDGPRGPRYVLKPGVVMAARESSAKVIPFSWESDRFWQLGTWDQLRIPKPFSKIKIIFGDPLTVPKQNQRKLEDEVASLQSALQRSCSLIREMT